MATPGQRVFTGASVSSRVFEALVTLGAAGLVGLMALRLSAPHSSLETWPMIIVAAIAGASVIAAGGLFTVPTGHKTHRNPGSGAVFALLLTLPFRYAFPIAFIGMLVAQILRRHYHHQRLGWQTITFNLSQYGVTWALTSATFVRLQDDLAGLPSFVAWLAAATCAAAVYMLVNTWLVAVHNALRRGASAWELWVHSLRHLPPSRWIPLAVGALAAQVAITAPLLALGVLWAQWFDYWTALRSGDTERRRIAAALAMIIETAERRSFDTVEHSERVSWLAERLAWQLEMSEADVDAIALAAKLHDLGRVALGVPIDARDDEETAIARQHPIVASDIVTHIVGLEGAGRGLRSQAEHYDGGGYPDGVVGDAIPLASRIIAVAEAYDLLIVHAGGAASGGHERALAFVEGRSDRRFDPRVVAALRAVVTQPSSYLPTERLARPVLAPVSLDAPTVGHAMPRRWLRGALRVADRLRTSPFPRHGTTPVQPAPEIEEAIRRKVASDLHDEVGTSLTWLSYAMEAVPDHPVVEEARAHVRELMARVHNIALDLRPAGLEELGLIAAVARHVERYSAMTRIRVDVSHTGLDRRFPRALEVAAFRIIQEGLTNTAKYARTDHVAVRIAAHRHTLSVLVEDRGAGFDMTTIGAEVGGLAGMRERAVAAGGTLVVTSQPGVGTRIEAHLPLGDPIPLE